MAAVRSRIDENCKWYRITNLLLAPGAYRKCITGNL